MIIMSQTNKVHERGDPVKYRDRHLRTEINESLRAFISNMIQLAMQTEEFVAGQAGLQFTESSKCPDEKSY